MNVEIELATESHQGSRLQDIDDILYVNVEDQSTEDFECWKAQLEGIRRLLSIFYANWSSLLFYETPRITLSKDKK